MQYMLLVYMNEQAMNDAERQECFVKSAALTRELHAQGRYVAASPLQLVATAKSVRVRNAHATVTDGPFAETREQLGGFYIINADNLDQAIDVAARIPPATKGTIEIRPILDLPGLPEARS